MCCRFYTDDTTKKDILSLVEEYDKNINWLREGDVHPGDPATVITGKEGALCASEMVFGMTGKDNTLLMNAKAETVKEKKTFSESVRERRCVICAKHFYEWDREKNKVQFSVPSERSVYLAGIYREEEDGKKFCILTTKANSSMEKVHDRMPLILTRDEVAGWTLCGEKTDELLGLIPPELSEYREFEQLSLFDL